MQKDKERYQPVFQQKAPYDKFIMNSKNLVTRR